MTHLLGIVDRFSRAMVGLAFFCMIVAVVIQLLGRNALFDAPVWTEELTRFGLLYLAAFGLGPSLRTGDLVNVDLFCESLSGRKPWLLRLLSSVLSAAMCIILIKPAWQFTSIGAMQSSPALGWRMDLIHVTMLIALISLLVYSLARIAGMLTGTTDGLPENPFGEEK
ncbi:TRAP transporter small permease [Allopusillimonas ginsengisoli]|uniref:TRAP transporter small permease n=1 Tax=Allopusillimonas ginsengisoli TaxID=453575 RepID=UPI00197ED451